MENKEQKVAIAQSPIDNGKQSSQNIVNKDLSQHLAKTPSKSDISLDTKKGEKIIYEETPYRFVIVVTYFLLCFANGFQWVTFSSCAAKFGETYGLNNTEVNIFSLLYMILYPFVCIPQGYLIDNYSTRLGLIIAAALTLASAGLKCLVNHSMGAVYFGQFLAALFQPAILNSPGKIAANWFRVNARTLVTTICCIANTIGILFGFVFHTFIIEEDAEGQEYKDQFFDYVFWEFILNLIFCLPSFFILRNKPINPPSPSQDRTDIPPLLQSLKLLFTNKKFIYLLISTCFIVGYYCVYGTILNAYLYLYEITDAQSSYIYAVASGVGILSSIAVSALLDRYKKFKLFMIILAVLGTILQALFTLLLELSLNGGMSQYAIGMVMYSLVNAIVIPFYTIGMNYACEITYPVGESITGGIMMSMSQISGIAGTFGCDALITKQPNIKYLTNIVLLLFFIIALIFVFLFDDKLARSDLDEKKNKENKEGIKTLSTQKTENAQTLCINQGEQKAQETDGNKQKQTV